MGVAAYNTVVERVGSSTAFTGEPMTATGATNEYQIDDKAKSIWDRTATFTVYEDSVDVTSDVTGFNYVLGKVVFATAKTGSISVDGSYLPRQAIAGANSYTLSHTGDLLDDTDFTSTGFRTRRYGLRDVSVSIERYYPLNKHFLDAVKNGEIVVISIQPGGTQGGSTEYARGYFTAESAELAGDVSNLENESLSFQLDGDPDISFDWGTA